MSTWESSSVPSPKSPSLSLQPFNTSHTMHLRIPCPLPKRFPIIPKYNPSKTPQQNKRHVRHNRRNIAILNNPRRNKLRESVTPNIFINRNRHENWTCHRLVRVDGVCWGDWGESGNLDTGAGVANDYDDLFSISIFIMDGEESVIYLPVPGTLVAYGYNHISNNHKNNIRNHSN